MNVSAASIRNPVPSVLLFILLTLAGLIAFHNNPVQDFPDIELPMVTVNASLPGAAPAQLETEIARKLENAVATLQGVKHQYVKVLDGNVSLFVEFVLEKDSSDAVSEVRDAISRVRADLPADMRDPVISKASTAGRPVILYSAKPKEAAKGAPAKAQSAAEQQRFDEALSWYVDNTVTRALLNVQGVGAVRRVGGVTREVAIELDPGRMAALGMTAADVSRRLREVQQEAPGGRGDVGGQEQSVRTIATVGSAGDLAAMELPMPDGRRIRLDQIATITDTVAEQRATALLNGEPVVGLEIMRTRGASETDVAAHVQKAVAELNAGQARFELIETVNNATAVGDEFKASMRMLYEGALLAIVVVFLFLRDWRATFVSAVALPLSLLPAFLGIYWFGFTLNGVTLISLALVVGVLVDDAIVEVENINRHLAMGKTPYQAAMEAADEIGLAVIATTFALVAVFLPTAFMAGIPGKFFKQFGWAAVLAILASLLVARMLTPMMAAYMMRPNKHTEPRDDGWIMRSYLKAMKACLNHRWLTMIGTAVLFVASISLSGLIPKGFVPPADRAQTIINVELPPGSTLAQTYAAAEKARMAVADHPDVKSIFSSIGGGASGDIFAQGAEAEARRAVMTVTLSHRSERSGKTQQDIETEIRERLAHQPGVRLTVGPQDVGVKMQLVLRSDDPLALDAAAKRVERDLRTLNDVGNITSSASLVRPEIIIEPDAARAADLGVTTAAIADTVRIATAGDYDISLAKLNLAERQVPIRVKLPNAVRADLNAIERLHVPGRNGPVMLSQVASIRVASGPAQISRLDRSRNIVLDVELAGRELGEVHAEALKLPSIQQLPPSVKLVEQGDAQEMVALFASFALAMAIGVLCIYMVLVLLFHDFLQPITILAALPLSIGGAFVLLLVTGKSLSMPSLIGLVMLMGIVTKNSILLVDYAILARRDGMPRFEALVDACHKRARPIIMTTIAMGAGMLPTAMGLGADPSFRSPMSVAVIGGLITSTLLSLLVVPAVFTIIDDLQGLLRKLVSKRSHKG